MALLRCCDDVLGNVLLFVGTHGPCLRVTCRRFSMLHTTGEGAGVALLYVRRIERLWPGTLPRHPAPPGVARLVLMELPECNCSSPEAKDDRYGSALGRVCQGADRLSEACCSEGCHTPCDEPMVRRGRAQLHGGDAEMWHTVGPFLRDLAARYPGVTTLLHSGQPHREFGAAVGAAWLSAVVSVVLAEDEFRCFSGDVGQGSAHPAYRRRDLRVLPPHLRFTARRVHLYCSRPLGRLPSVAPDTKIFVKFARSSVVCADLARAAHDIGRIDVADLDWHQIVAPGPPAASVAVHVRADAGADVPPLPLPRVPLVRVRELRLEHVLPLDAAEFSRAFPALCCVSFHQFRDHGYPDDVTARLCAVLQLPHVREYRVWNEDDVPYASSLDLPALAAVGRARAAADSLPLAVDVRVYKLHPDNDEVAATLRGPGLCPWDVDWDDLFGEDGELVP